MNEFRYFHLPDISYFQLLEAFPSWDEQYSKDAYRAWYHHYVRFSSICYRMQFQRHQDYTWKAFCAKYDLNESDYLYSEDESLWDEFAGGQGLWEHERRNEQIQNQLRKADEAIDPNRPEVITDIELQERYIRHLEAKRPWPDSTFIQFKIDELWFNTIVQATPDDITARRRMPYPDYLKTDHWKRVKIAMLIAHRARCQSSHCFGLDSYWADESSLHVHHVSYKNRGCERFADLRLLCNLCHERIHINADNFFPQYLDGFYAAQLGRQP